MTYFIESVELANWRWGLKLVGDRTEMKERCIENDCMWWFV